MTSSVSSKPKPTERQIQAMLDKGSRVLRKHDSQWILVCHKLGQLLNAGLGDPDFRQPYGKGIIDRAVKQWGRSRSELYRMRKFAHAKPDVNQFLMDHPQITTWSSVKVYLGTTSGTNGQENSDVKAAYAVAGMRRSIRSLAKRVPVWKSIPLDDRRGLRQEVGELLTVLREVFDVTVQIETSCPSDSEDENEPRSPIVVPFATV